MSQRYQAARALFGAARWLAIAGLLAWRSAPAAEPDNVAAAPTLKFQASTFRDVLGTLDKERSVGASQRDAEDRLWRWQASQLDAVRDGTSGRAQAAGLHLELPAPPEEALRPWHLLRSVGGKLNTSGGQAAEWSLVVGQGPVSFEVERSNIAWWLGLRTLQRRLQAYPSFGGIDWGLECARLSVSDGNRVQDCLLRADPQWAAWGSKTALQGFVVLHRRVAAFYSPYYWSPVQAETSAGLGLKTSVKQGAWSAQGELQQLRPLNAQTAPSRRYNVVLRWQPLPALRIGWSISRGRSGALVDPYRSAATELTVECRCLDGGVFDDE